MRLDREHAHALDGADPLAAWHDRFILPRDAGSGPRTRLPVRSLARARNRVLATEYVEDVMRDWRSLGVEGHFTGRHPWMSYHERLAPALATLVGAETSEVIAMNTLTVNLHLMLVSFYRPSGTRRAILLERAAFPSDRHAVESQVRCPRPRSRRTRPDRDRAARRRRLAARPRTSSRRSTAKARASPRSCCRASST